MAPKKKVSGLIKLQIEAGAANPAPPVGPALGAHGVNIMEFCKAYNAATESQRGNVVPVEITVYEDRSFTFKLKTPPAAKLLLKAAGLQKGSGVPHTQKVGKVTMDQVRDHCRYCPVHGHRGRGLKIFLWEGQLRPVPPHIFHHKFQGCKTL